MPQARVESLDVLKSFKVALVKFIEAANVAIVDAESDLNRTKMWIETEQSVFWQRQIKQRQAALARAEEALRMKKIFKDVSGARQSYIDEEKAVQKARRAVEHAEQKSAATMAWKRKMEKVSHDFKGSIQKLGTTVAADLPNAVARVENLLRTLEQYVALGPAEATSTTEPGLATSVDMIPSGQSVARPIDEPPPPPEQSKSEVQEPEPEQG
jgi:hypothetical protein